MGGVMIVGGAGLKSGRDMSADATSHENERDTTLKVETGGSFELSFNRDFTTNRGGITASQPTCYKTRVV